MTERRVARVVLAVDVWVGRDPGMDTPDGYEPPHDYLVVRNAEELGVATFGDLRPLELVGIDDFPDHDPDDLIHSALKAALYIRHKETA